jgi:hypothetical protein
MARSGGGAAVWDRDAPSRQSGKERILVDAVRDRVARSGRQSRQNRQSVVAPAVAREMVAEKIRDTLRHLPMMRCLGVLDRASAQRPDANNGHRPGDRR